MTRSRGYNPLGIEVHVSPLLPVPITPAEEALRIVRHGYAAARAATGLAMYFPDSLGDVGPKPGDRVQAIDLGDRLLVSQAMWDRLREKAERAVPFSAGVLS